MEQENLAFIVGGDTHLFHGTAVQGIDALKKGIEDTLGTGVYFTSDRKAAEGYARVRNGRGGHPTVYEAVAPDAKFVDLRDIPTLDAVMQGYLELIFYKISDRDFLVSLTYYFYFQVSLFEFLYIFFHSHVLTAY